MKTINISTLLIIAFLFMTSCQKDAAIVTNQQQTPKGDLSELSQSDFASRCRQSNSNDVAVQWVQLQQRLIKTTAGFGPGPSGRFFAYSGITMYEALLPSLSNYYSLVQQFSNKPALPACQWRLVYHGAASVNAAMAQASRHFFAATSAANKTSIDSLETVFATQFQDDINAAGFQRSVDFGKQVANAIFEWSKTDGTFAINPPYVPPVGPGLWVPTPPAFGPAINPYGGTIRPFVNGLDRISVPPPPFAYSETAGSNFYKMANELYLISQNLSTDETNIAKTWGDIPGNFNGPAHFTNVVTQLITKYHLALDDAAVLYAKNGMALNDAGIITFKIKYQYNQVRPITYIRNVLGHSTWNTVIPTPSHPEYLAAHAVVAQSTAEVLKNKFGSRLPFKDNTHENLYGTRTYTSFDAYAREAGFSRVLAGIHYRNTVNMSLPIGGQVGKLVNRFQFKRRGY